MHFSCGGETLRSSLLNILVCQDDKSQDLSLLVFKECETMVNPDTCAPEVQEGMIVCNKCSRWYPITNGILKMLPDGTRTAKKKKVAEDVAFLNKWKKHIPQEVLDEGRPTNLSRSATISLLEKTKSSTISQHEELSDEAAKKYQLHELMNPATRYIMRREEEVVSQGTESVSDGKIALDLGCGTGRHMVELAKKFRMVVGLDISGEMIHEARRIFSEKGITNTEFIIGDAEHLMFLPETFDLVVASFGLLSFLFNCVSATNDICRTLKVGGRLYATVYNRKFKDTHKFLQSLLPWRSPLAISWSTKKPNLMAVQFGSGYKIHSKSFKPKELWKLLSATGIDCDSLYCTPVIMPLFPRCLLTYTKIYKLIVNVEKKIDSYSSQMGWLPLRGAYIIIGGRKKSSVCPPHDFSRKVTFAKAGLVKEELLCSRCGCHQIVEYEC